MSYPSMQPIPIPPVGPGENGDEGENDRELVGDSDAEADAARSGSDVDLTGAQRDSDGVPVGDDDVQADIDRSSHE
jgi:hypothetical protein